MYDESCNVLRRVLELANQRPRDESVGFHYPMGRIRRNASSTEESARERRKADLVFWGPDDVLFFFFGTITGRTSIRVLGV